jgi:hypothetical protein
MRHRRSGITAHGAILRITIPIAFVVLSPIAALAQVAPDMPLRPGPFEYIKADRRIVQTQLALGVKYAEQALPLLQGASEPEELQRIDAIAHKSYVLLRFAMHGVQEMESRKPSSRLSVDPLVKMALTKIGQAMERNRHARLAIQNTIPYPATRIEYVANATRNLQESIPYALQAIKIVQLLPDRPR